jgi:hypothetical protein
MAEHYGSLAEAEDLGILAYAVSGLSQVTGMP